MVEDLNAKAREIIRANRYMVLATCSTTGKPWATPLFYAYDEEYSLYFVSSDDSRHVMNLVENPHVGVAIFDSTQSRGSTDGVQISGEASWIRDPDDLERAITIYYKRFIPKTEPPIKIMHKNYLPPSKFRFFKVSVIKAYMPGEKRRVEVKLA